MSVNRKRQRRIRKREKRKQHDKQLAAIERKYDQARADGVWIVRRGTWARGDG